MKTAISLPEDIFVQADRLARRLRKSRSQLYREAVAEYLARHDPDALEKTVVAHVQLFRERVQGLLESGEAEAFVLAGSGGA